MEPKLLNHLATTRPNGLSENVIQPTPLRSYKHHHRLLYRGSLSLPDADLILDGIAFTAHLPPTSPTLLLESPLALALESMRGRPSLRFVAIVNMKDVNYDSNGDISMYINPQSTITRSFFENVLCMDQIGENGKTDCAIRIGLGDGYGPDESDLLVFGSLLLSQSTLRMTVAPITPPRPPVAGIRKPRPDDPAPRKPPTFELSRKYPSSKRHRINHEDGVSEEPRAKRGKVDKTIDLKSLMARETMHSLPTESTLIGKAKGKGRASGQGPSFKLPSLPKQLHGEDVFGFSTGSASSRAVDSNDLESSNKMVVKRATVKALAARGMPKEHPEFKELFGWVTRGVGFSLRRKMKTVKLGSEEVERLVDSHVQMYFDGFGGPVVRK